MAPVLKVPVAVAVGSTESSKQLKDCGEVVLSAVQVELACAWAFRAVAAITPKMTFEALPKSIPRK
jgi:hypothetical protein